ncbi:HP0495 family protein [Legionella sp.]|uniref:HP0495 family protein n=1 Tax=Legionella sp. TaxID=459 RepID=UPI003C8AEAA8
MTETILINFPCHFPIKIMGSNTPTFLNEIREIILKHFPSIEQEKIVHKMSKKNNYLAITVTVYAENQKMLDAFYREITKHPNIKMVL